MLRKLIPLSIVGLLAFGVAEGCKKSKDASAAKPATPTAGKTQPAQPSGKSEQQATELCANNDPNLIVCVCVEGGFVDADGDVWDYDCCVGTVEWLITCGDSATCNADTFACEDL